MEFETWNREKLMGEIRSLIDSETVKCIKNGDTVSLMKYIRCEKDDLNKKTNSELKNIYVDLKENDEAFVKQLLDKQESNMFYNRPSANADYQYWGKHAYWSIDEAIALILGKDPRVVKWDDIKQYTSSSQFVKKYQEIREIAKRYVSCGQLNNNVAPGVFLAWAVRMGFCFSEKLQETVKALGIQIADWQSLHRQAIELLDGKDKVIQALEVMNQKLELDCEELRSNPHQMNQESDNYAPELDAANIIYRAIINNPDGSMSFKKRAIKLLDELYPGFSDDAKKRIAKVINTTKGKNGGRGRKN